MALLELAVEHKPAFVASLRHRTMIYGALENWVVLLCKYAGMNCGLKTCRPARYQNIQNNDEITFKAIPSPSDT